MDARSGHRCGRAAAAGTLLARPSLNLSSALRPASPPIPPPASARAIQITRVGSRFVVQLGAGVMILLGMIGKFGGLFASLPRPLISGLFCIVFGIIAAVGLAMLAHTDQRSDRNIFIGAGRRVSPRARFVSPAACCPAAAAAARMRAGRGSGHSALCRPAARFCNAHCTLHTNTQTPSQHHHNRTHLAQSASASTCR